MFDDKTTLLSPNPAEIYSIDRSEERLLAEIPPGYVEKQLSDTGPFIITP